MRILFLADNFVNLAYFSALAAYIRSLEKQGCRAQVAIVFSFFLLEFLWFLRSFTLSSAELEWVTEFEFRRKVAKNGWANRDFLNLKARLYYIKYFTLLRQGKYEKLCVFGGSVLPIRAAIVAARHLGIKVFFFDETILAGSVAVDLRGAGFLNSVPRERSFYEAISPVVMPKNGVDKGYIYVPFQDDFSPDLLLYSPRVSGMKNLFEILTRILPRLDSTDLIFITKDGAALKGVENARIVVSDLPEDELISGAKCVLTLNSSAGISGLFWGKRVIVLGDAFYGSFSFAKNVRGEEELIDALNSLDSWAASLEDIGKFLTYLQDIYCISGWKAGERPTSEHLRAIARKVLL